MFIHPFAVVTICPFIFVSVLDLRTMDVLNQRARILRQDIIDEFSADQIDKLLPLSLSNALVERHDAMLGMPKITMVHFDLYSLAFIVHVSFLVHVTLIDACTCV